MALTNWCIRPQPLGKCRSDELQMMKTSRFAKLLAPPIFCVLLVPLTALESLTRSPLVYRGQLLRLRGGKFDENLAALDVIQRPVGKKKAVFTPFEEHVASVLFQAQAKKDELRMLKYLHVVSARQVRTPEGEGEQQTAAVLMVPYIEIGEYRKLASVLVPYLQEQLQSHIFLIAYRRILSRERKGLRLLKQKRPRSRTLTAVHEAYLADTVWPHRVVGQHSVHEIGDTTPTHRIFLDPKVREATESILLLYKAVYRALTGKKVWFDYYVLPEGTPYEQQRCPNIYPLGFPAAPLFPPAESPAVEPSEMIAEA